MEFWPRDKQMKYDAKVAAELAAEFEPDNQKVLKQKRIVAENNAKTLSLLNAWNEGRFKCDADMELAKKLTQEEQEMHSIEERAQWLKEYMDQRRNFYAAKRLKKKMLRPPII